MDVLAYLWGPGADLAFRRGWTHGVLALALWPFVLAGSMVLLDRAIQRFRPASPPVHIRPGQLLLLSVISILTHPALDTLNTYGVRWLMPFSGRWFYGDTLFIVDPWLWLALGLGVLLSRRAGGTGHARIALWIALGYSAAMAAGTVAARGIARTAMEAIGGAPVTRILVSPVPLTPLRRSVVVEQGDSYRTAEFHWLAKPHVEPGSVRVHPGDTREHPAVRAAERTTLGRRFLVWARFPSFRVEEGPGGGAIVHIVDLRYADRPGVRFGAVSIPVGSPAQLEVREYRKSTSSTNSALSLPSLKR